MREQGGVDRHIDNGVQKFAIHGEEAEESYFGKKQNRRSVQLEISHAKLQIEADKESGGLVSVVAFNPYLLLDGQQQLSLRRQ